MKLYLVRHGITQEHENKKSQAPDSPLSKEGKRQARLLAKRLKKQGLRFDVVFASPFERARKTAEIIASKLDTKFELMETIHEKLNAKYLYGHGPDDSVFAEYIIELKQFWGDLDWKFRGEGESIRDVINRAREFEKHLLTNHMSQNILAVSHGTFGRCLIASCILGQDIGDEALSKLFQAMHIDNTGLSLLEYLEEEEVWQLRILNDHSHLQ